MQVFEAEVALSIEHLPLPAEPDWIEPLLNEPLSNLRSISPASLGDNAGIAGFPAAPPACNLNQ